MNYVLSRLLGRSAALLVLAAAVPSLAFADLPDEAQLAPSASAGALAGNGGAISDDGALAVVGAPGDEAAYIFTRSGTTWTQGPTLTADDSHGGDHFGASVSISGKGTSVNVAIGAPDRGAGAGAVYVFTLSAGVWSQKTTPPLTSALTSAGHLGTSVSIQGLRIAAGAPTSTAGKGANAGVAIVFDFDTVNNVFTRTTFRANGGQARVGGLFGTSVSLSGSTVLVGAPGYSTGHKSSGNVFVFVNNGGSYTQQASIRPGNITNNFAGTSVSLFNDTAAFGAPGNSNNKGMVYIYKRTGTTWASVASISDPGNTAGDKFGSSVAQLGPFVVVGAPGTNSNTGASYEYAANGSNYSLANKLVPDPTQAAGATFGFSTSVNSGRALVGAPADGAAGSAYVFKFLVPSVTTVVSASVDPALTGEAYTVNVNVNHDVGGSGTPSGTVHVSDGVSGACDATLDGSGNGSCLITSDFFGVVTLKAAYDGDLNFSPSQDAIGLQLMVTGDHLVFSSTSTPPPLLPTPLDDVPQGNRFAGLVEVRNGAGALITSYDGFPVTLTVGLDACGDTDTIGPVNVSGGIATFNGIGDRFYTIAPLISLSASMDTSVPPPAIPPPANANTSINVVADPLNFVFADGFEDCRL